MEKSNQYDELFIRYLLNDLNREEEEFVFEWINSSEQNRQYFEDLKKTWNLTAVKELSSSVNMDDEWHHFKQSVALKQQEEASAENEIIEFEKPDTNRKFYRLLFATAIAASILLVIAIGLGLFSTEKPDVQPVAKTGSNKTNAPLAAFRYRVNTSGKTEKIKLQDGSEILLFNQSEISYNEPFINNKRDIILKGKADFKVAKDSSKPFTVYSGDVSTIALGTRFTVTAYEMATNIIVRLHEGKILVKTAYNTKQGFQKDFYLLPGDEFVYDKNKLTTILRTFKGKNAFVKGNGSMDMTSGDDPSLPTNNKGSWYMFNNQSLAQVFEELGNMYNVKITYSKKDVYNKYFIGRFNKSDSLDYILKQIASLNHLKVTVEKDGFEISKK